MPLAAPIPAALARDPDAFLGALLPVVTAWCLRLAAPGVDAEAAAQDTLLVLLRRRGDLWPGAPVEPWAWGITKRVLRDHKRRAWWRRWVPGATLERPDPRPGDEPSRRERVRLVQEILDRLPDHHREVLVLCDAEERSGPEVAAMLGLPLGTLKSRLRLGRSAFRAEAERQGLSVCLLLEDSDDA